MSFNAKITGDFDRDRFIRLAGKACEESIEEWEFRELEIILKTSDEARALFRSYTNIHVTLGNCFGAVAQSVSPGTGAVEVIPVEAPESNVIPIEALPRNVIQIDASHVEASRSWKPRAGFGLAAAAAIALGLGGFWYFRTANRADGPAVVEVREDLPAAKGPAKAAEEKPAKTLKVAEVKSPAPPPRVAPPPGAMALVKSTIKVKQLSQKKRIRKGDWIMDNEMYEIKEGMVCLTFVSGATASIRGPARFQIVSGNALRFEEGELFSRVPPAASGFRVLTAVLDVVDIGTAFGVTAFAAGEVEVQVHEGEVDLHAPRKAPEALAGVKKLHQGEAIRARSSWKPEAAAASSSGKSMAKTAIESLEFAPQRFRRLASVSAGLSSISPMMRFEESGPLRHLREYESNEFLYVFPESRRVELTKPVEVAVAEPGEYGNDGTQELVPVGAGMTVRSYLLHFNPVGAASKKGHSFKGSIVFDAQIVGIIMRTNCLEETDALFASNLERYRNYPGRAIDSNDSGDARKGGDKVTLEENGRTLHLNWSASSATDQIRVLVLDEGF